MTCVNTAGLRIPRRSQYCACSFVHNELGKSRSLISLRLRDVPVAFSPQHVSRQRSVTPHSTSRSLAYNETIPEKSQSKTPIDSLRKTQNLALRDDWRLLDGVKAQSTHPQTSVCFHLRLIIVLCTLVPCIVPLLVKSVAPLGFPFLPGREKVKNNFASDSLRSPKKQHPFPEPNLTSLSTSYVATSKRRLVLRFLIT